jgi:putative hydrolase of the HAD superfamily
MKILALDVDGVLLDPNRGGVGHWSSELERRHEITRTQLRSTFFAPYWEDIVNGRRRIEDALSEALELIGSEVDCEAVLSCWFETDFVPVDAVIALANFAAECGIPVVLATNQEHRRAAFLRERLGKLFPIHDVIYSAELGYQKHEKAFFEGASRRLGFRTDELDGACFVDDLLLNVETALAAGWTGVHADAGGEWRRTVELLIEGFHP